MFAIIDPLPPREALDSRAVKTLLPTTLRTRAMETLAPAVRERAFWSAGVTSAEYLQKANDVVDQILRGQIDRATGRQQLDEMRAQLGAPSVQEVGKGGGLTDLWSERRQNVLLDTNVQMARGYGQWMQGQDPDVLDQFPAQELIRLEDRTNWRDWPQRWQEAGGQFYPGSADYSEGRMIALKDDPIWVKISAFGLPYPPFDFDSGMGIEDVDRAEAEDLGIITPDQTVKSQDRGFNDDFQMTPQVRSQNLLEELIKAFAGTGLKLKDGIFEEGE